MAETGAGTDVEGGLKHVTSTGKFDGVSYDVTIQNLTYKVTKKNKEKELVETYLLTNVNARARHGQITAVVGPSGAGKSTFLDAVAGRIDPNSLEGSILINGKQVEDSFKRSSGYVMQDDALFPMLTVRETLMFSAKLRLPESMSHEEKRERVDMLINELGLQSCAETKIGNADVRGVSGGEKRRVSIGVDLIHDPPVLFLDEPTSGLDSTSALSCVQILHDIAEQRKRTILLTIHQPSFRILGLIHNFLVLAKGNAVYHGPQQGLIKHFEEFGREVPEHVNVLEYALDVIEEYQKTEEGIGPLIAFYEEKAHIDKGLSMHSSMGGHQLVPEYATSFFSEIVVLADRNFKNISRTPELFGGRLGLMAVTAFVMGSLFFNVDVSSKGIQQRQSFFSFSIALLLFTSTEALPIFLDERLIYIRESSRGAYRTSSYVVANAVVFVPFLFVLALLFSTVSYFMVGLETSAEAFFLFVTINFLALAVANSYVIFWAGFVPNFIAGNTIVTATTAFMFLFCGFFIPRSDIPDYWIWLHYLSNFKYPIEMLEKNEYSRFTNVCWNGGSIEGCTKTSQDVLDSFSAGNVKIWENSIIMVALFIGYRILFYLALRVQTMKVRK